MEGVSKNATGNKRWLGGVLLALDAFVIGGCVALLLMGRMLHVHGEVYIEAEAWRSFDAIYELQDDLVLHYLIYGQVLLTSLLITGTTWLWLKTTNSWLRYLAVLVTLAASGFSSRLWIWSENAAPDATWLIYGGVCLSLLAVGLCVWQWRRTEAAAPRLALFVLAGVVVLGTVETLLWFVRTAPEDILVEREYQGRTVVLYRMTDGPDAWLEVGWRSGSRLSIDNRAGMAVEPSHTFVANGVPGYDEEPAIVFGRSTLGQAVQVDWGDGTAETVPLEDNGAFLVLHDGGTGSDVVVRLLDGNGDVLQEANTLIPFLID